MCVVELLKLVLFILHILHQTWHKVHKSVKILHCFVELSALVSIVKLDIFNGITLIHMMYPCVTLICVFLSVAVKCTCILC